MSEPSLPPELWASIFFFTSASPFDIASCRLVSKAFCNISSEYLITRVVVAKRMGALQRLWNVLEHPTFRRYVTELVYDDSSYHDNLARPSEYTYVCNKFSSRAYLRKGAESRSRELEQLSRQIRQTIPLCDDDDDLETDTGAGFLDFTSESAEYHQRWLGQQVIVRRNLHLDSLECALHRLPNLRTITYTDFRYLALAGEPYIDLCQRLFGGIVEPNGMRLDFEHDLTELLSVLRTLQRVPDADIRSLAIGGHQYECSEMDRNRPLVERTFIHLPWKRAALPFDFNDYNESHDHESDDDEDLSLEHLRLPVEVPLQDALDEIFVPRLDLPKSHLKAFLQLNASTLRHLELSAVEDHVSGGDFERTLAGITQDFFTALLDEIEFESLHCLELHNWTFRDAQPLREVLSRHSSTLKDVRLVRCNLYEDPTDIARWAGEHMLLTGVDIDLRTVHFLEDDEDYDIDSDDDANDTEDDNENVHDDGRSNDSSVSQEKVEHGSYFTPEQRAAKKDEAKARPLSLQESYDQEKAELEQLWLAGRSNALHRPSRALSLLSLRKLLKDSYPKL